MSVKRFSVADILALKHKHKRKIVVLTAYHAGIAALCDEVCDILLVGDSLGMVLHGLPSTLPVTVEMMITATQAVMRGSQKAFVVTDLPFGSYETSKEQAFATASRIMKETGCMAVKLEGGVSQKETIDFLTKRGIPVMAHIGLQPQSVNVYGGYKVQGGSEAAADLLMQDAIAIEESGAFSCVLEGIKEPIAKQISQKLKIPTIGIGASVACDGQVLVTDDLLGLGEYVPKFVKQYADVGDVIRRAIQMFADEVQDGTFPSKDYIYE